MIFEIAHQMGLVPLVAMLLLGRDLPRAYWLVAAAFAISWVGDSLTRYAGHSWGVAYFWLPVQFALVLMAIQPRDPLWMAVLFVTAAVSWLHSASGPEWIIAIVGSLAVLAYARGPLAIPLRIYFGLGTLLFLWMLATMEDIMPAWYSYQACRLIAYVAFAAAVVREAHVVRD